jgi:TetR/AcrR family transcriptional regulator
MATDRKRLILDAATKSFTLFGYKATTMEQVAKLANVGKGTIYNFFTNKEELFKEIVHGLIFDMKQAAEEVICNEKSFNENLHAALYRILEYRMKHQFTIKLLQEEKEIGTPAVAEMASEIEKAIVSYIKLQVEKAIVKGEITKCDPEITAFIMLKMYIALIFDWEQNHQPLDKEEIARLFELYIFKGLSN